MSVIVRPLKSSLFSLDFRKGRRRKEKRNKRIEED